MTYNVEATKDGISWITIATGYTVKSYANSLAWILVYVMHDYQSSRVIEINIE